MNLPKLTNKDIDGHILRALEEDITYEDITTASIVEGATPAKVELLAKEDGVIAGCDVFERTFTLLDKSAHVEWFIDEGARVSSGELLAVVYADAAVLLSGERVALNYIQRMSGIATYTASLAKELEGTKTKLVDTRKTTPTMRIFEKYAVRVGGGFNHRYNLSDHVLLKDNHIDFAGSISRAVEMAREYAPFVRKIEVEVESLEGVQEALESGADIIMLDNFDLGEIGEAIDLIDGRAIIEVSGNIDRSNIRDYADLGVDIISSGAITHSAPVLDLSMKNLKVE